MRRYGSTTHPQRRRNKGKPTYCSTLGFHDRLVLLLSTSSLPPLAVNLRPRETNRDIRREILRRCIGTPDMAFWDPSRNEIVHVLVSS